MVALDPGHGGIDPGAISPHGTYEKNITLATARELARQLERTGRYRTVLTRRGDTYVSLRERVARARAAHVELFLSIHADRLPDQAMRGLAVYTLSNEASDRDTAALAARENKDDFVAGVRLSHQPREIGAILLDLARRQTDNRSLMLAQVIVEELGHVTTLLERPHRAAGFAVLTAPDIPSALVEPAPSPTPRTSGCCGSAPTKSVRARAGARDRRLFRGGQRGLKTVIGAHPAAGRGVAGLWRQNRPPSATSPR